MTLLNKDLKWVQAPPPTLREKISNFFEPVKTALTGLPERYRPQIIRDPKTKEVIDKIDVVPTTGIRPPFAKEPIYVAKKFEPLKIIPETASRLIEVIPKAAAQAVVNLNEIVLKGEADPVTLPFDARRLGFDSPEIESTGRKLWNKFLELEDTNPSQNANDRAKNAMLASLMTVVPDTLDVFIAGSMADLGARAVLKTTKYDPMLERSMSQLGIGKNEAITPHKIIERTKQSWLNAKTVHDQAEILKSGKYISEAYKGQGIPQLSPFFQKLQNAARDMVLPMDQLGMGFQVRPISPHGPGLPGWAAEPKFGFQISPRVGGTSGEITARVKDLATQGLKPEVIAQQLSIPKASVDATLKGITKTVAETIIPKELEPLAQEAIKNTPGVKILPEGIELDITRFQKPEQFGAPSIRTGVFYLPELKSPYAKYYSTGKYGYGGGELVGGRTVLQNPIIVKAGTGGKGAEKAYDIIKGKGAYEKMRSDVLENAWGKDLTGRKPDYNAISNLLKKYGGKPELTDDIIHYSREGNLLPYAIQEHIVANAVREAGYDAILSHSVSAGKPRLSEVFDVRAMEYPREGMKFEYPDFYTQATKGITDVKPDIAPPVQEAKPVTDKFFQKYKEPGIEKWITPSDSYARRLGVYDLLEPSIKAKTKLEIERTQVYAWLDKMQQQWLKLNKTSFSEKLISAIKNKPTKAHEKLFDALDKHTTAADAGLKGVEANIFNEMRNLTRTTLERTNVVREAAGLEPIRSVSSYVRHIRDVFAEYKIMEKYPKPESIDYFSDIVNAEHVYNPTAFRRMVDNPEDLFKDPFRALKSMVSADLKQVYLENPNILFKEEMERLKDIIPAQTRKWTEAYMREVIKGHPTDLDKLTNATINNLGIVRILDLALKPFGRKLGTNPIKEIAGANRRLVHDSTIWGRPKLVLRNHTQKLLTLGLYDTTSFIKGMMPAGAELKELIRNSDFWQISNKQFFEALPADTFSKLERIGFIPYGHSHTSNITKAMQVAYHWAKGQMKKTAHLPDGDPKKWTMDDVLKEMDFGANTTQYWYNLMGMPELYRSGALRMAGVLQTWWQNYTMKYWPEMMTRAFTGKTGWGKPIEGVTNRLGALRHIITSLLFVEGFRKSFGLDYSQVALLGALPSYISPPGQLLTGIYDYLTADTPQAKARASSRIKQSWRAFMPGSLAWRDWTRAWNEESLKSLLFYQERSTPKTPPAGTPGIEADMPGLDLPPLPGMDTQSPTIPSNLLPPLK